MGRALANNITNLRVEPVLERSSAGSTGLDPLEIIEQEPDAGLGNGGLGRLAACFLDSMATLGIPGMGCGPALRVRHLQADHARWLAARAAGPLARATRPVGSRASGSKSVEVQLGVLVRGARRSATSRARKPVDLIGIPYDRPVVGYGGKTINTLRLWSASTPDYFDFQQFSAGDFVGALAETLTAETVTRVLYPDDSTTRRQGAALRAAVLPGGVHAGRRDPPVPRRGQRLVRAAGQGRDPAQRHASDAGGARADADPARRGEARLGRGVGSHAAHARVHQSHATCPRRSRNGRCAWFETLLPRQLEIVYEINRRFLDEVARRGFPATTGAWRA